MKADELAKDVGAKAACEALEVPRSSYYRMKRRQRKPVALKRKRSPRKLSPDERACILEVLHGDRFVDKAPDEIFATLAEEGTYLCSARTMYRILKEEKEVRERRRVRKHPHYEIPRLVATGPNQVWSWDITKLKGPVKWTYFHLYAIIDIFSRRTVGWMVAERESGELARRFIKETAEKHGIAPSELTLHSDRGTSMKSHTVAQLLADLGITKTHSRPRVSNDNAYSESQFKTLKYHPTFPEFFNSLEDAKAFCRRFFAWYNEEHKHHGIGLMSPNDVHFGRSDEIMARRQRTLDAAYKAHPERFVAGPPKAPQVPRRVWINKPKDGDRVANLATSSTHEQDSC